MLHSTMISKLESFKGRAIDLTRPVKVYRNLHGSAAHRYSVQQGGLVVAHGEQVILSSVKFVVNEAGRQRVLREKRKNVHAFVTGFVCSSIIVGEALPFRVSYNPYKAASFTVPGETDAPIHFAVVAIVSENGIFAI